MPARKSRQQRLDHTITIIQQRHGPAALRQGVAPASVPHVPTGFPDLDAALGISGLPRGRLTVLGGAPTSGKRTLAALVLARAQARGRHPVAYLDLHHACDADYLQRCGVDLDQLLVARPIDGRQALDMLLHIAAEPAWAACVFDPWSALGQDATTRRYAAGVLDDVAGRLARSGVACLVLDEPPSLGQGLLASLAGDPAAQALAHHAAVRLALTRERWHTLGPDVRGYQVQVQVQKNKLGPSGQRVTIDIRFNGTVRGNGL